MACPDIKGLKFSLKSREALADIKRVKELADTLAMGLAASTFINIFAGSNALMSSYNIASTDWKTWSLAMRGIPEILRERIRNIAGQAAYDNPFGTENKFWSAIAEGCHD